MSTNEQLHGVSHGEDQAVDSHQAAPSSLLWDKFVSQSWEQSPHYFSHEECAAMHLVPRVTQDDFFHMARQHAHKWFDHPEQMIDVVRFFVEDVDHLRNLTEANKAAVRRFLPMAEDKNFEGYSQRLQGILDNQGKHFVLTIDSLEVSAEFRSWVYAILANIYTRLGYVAVGSFISVFYGNYEVTPEGLHKHDDEMECEGAFFFSLKNAKNIRTWPESFMNTMFNDPRFLSGQIQATSYDLMKDDGTLRSITPGQSMYWTADTWHVAESQADTTIAFPLAARVACDVTMEFLAYLNETPGLTDSQKMAIHILVNNYNKETQGLMLKEKRNNRFTFPASAVKNTSESRTSLQEAAQQIPTEIDQAIAPIAELFDRQTLQRIKSEYWLRVLSCFGFSADMHRKPDIFAPQNASLSPEDNIRLHQYQPLLFTRCDNALIIGATGQSETRVNPPTNAIESMLSTLQSGERSAVKTVVEHGLGALTTEEQHHFDWHYFMQLLNKLNQWQILAVE